MGEDSVRTVAATPKAFSATVTVEPPPERSAASAFDKSWSEQSRYALVAELARGGGGKIGVAVDRKLGRKVALKRPLDADGNERLEREALVLARLEHPAIVPIHDAGHDGDGSPYYTMKLVGGHTLASRIDGATTFEQRVALLAAVTTVADAMAYAHAQHVIHRDLKPGNVLVGEFGEVAVIDWGLGKVLGDGELAASDRALGEQLTAHGSVLGTPAYMAPEQASDGAAADERADVYAIGAMLYHVLTGDVPYGRLDTEATLARLLTEPPPAVQEREPRVPNDLAAIVNKAMARDPANRYRTAREVAEDLHRYQTGRLVAAHRYRLHQRAWRWLRRHQLRAALAVAVAAVAGATVLFVRGGTVADETCNAIDAGDRAAWSPAVRGQGEQAFGKATAAWQGVAGAVDAQVAKIGAMRIEACRATRVTKHETESQMTARMACLDRRTSEVKSLAEVLAHADAGTIEHAAALASSLGRVEDCADTERLRDLAPLPADPAKRAEVLAVASELDKLAAQAAAGQSDAWRAAAEPLAKRADKTEYAPVIARALVRWGQSLSAQQRVDAAQEQLLAATAAADRGHDDATRAAALGELLAIEVDVRARSRQAADVYAQARAAAERSGNPDVLSAVLAIGSRLAVLRGAPDEAIALARDAHDDRALAVAELAAGKLDEADRTATAAIDAAKTRAGSEQTPEIAALYGVRGEIAWKKGDLEGAEKLLRREVEIEQQLKSPDILALWSAEEHVARVVADKGQLAEAFKSLDDLLGEIDTHFKTSNTTNKTTMAARTSKLAIDTAIDAAAIAERAGNHDQAIKTYNDALDRAEAGNESLPEYAETFAAIGRIQVAIGQAKDGLSHLRSALNLDMAREGADSLVVARRRLEVADAFEATGDVEDAAAEVAQALVYYEHREEKRPRGELRLKLADLMEKLGNKQGAATLREKAQAYLR